jgi:hypothetical protein
MSRAKSPSLIEWERQNVQFAYPAIDTLMQLVGLENFKEHVLAIKNKVNVSTGQSTNLKTERFGVLLQGNPGTGMFLPPIFRTSSNLVQEKPSSADCTDRS